MKNKVADIYESSAQGIERKHLPELRFPEFANTGEWEEKKLGDFFELKNGYAFKSDSYQENGKYKIITIANVQSGKLDLEKFNSLSIIPDNLADYQKLKEGDILVSMTGNVGRVCIVDKPNCLLNQRVGLLEHRNHNIDKMYVYHLINSSQFEKAMIREAQGAAQANISKGDIEQFAIILPPTIAEQQMIADCLSSIDKQILATQQKWNSLKEYKRGLMQKLFPANGKTTPDFRFSEFANTGEWETPTISEIFEIRNGYTPSKSESAYWDGGTIPWFRMEDIRENGGILSDSIQHITSLGVKGKGLFKKNSIILATTATIGIHAMIIADSLANQRFTNFSIRESLNHLYSPKYIYYAFYEIDEWCKRNTNAGGLLSVNMSALLKKTFYTPTLAEQQKIAECLSSLDELITAQAQKAEALKEHKRGLMQKLFPIK